MPTKINILLSFFLLTFSIIVYSQEQTNYTMPVTEKLYSYRFNGELSKTVSENLSNDILKMLFVSDVKIEYKSEKKVGQVRVWTKEKFININTEFQFNILVLHDLLVKYNLKPVEYNSDLIAK